MHQYERVDKPTPNGRGGNLGSNNQERNGGGSERAVVLYLSHPSRSASPFPVSQQIDRQGEGDGTLLCAVTLDDGSAALEAVLREENARAENV